MRAALRRLGSGQQLGIVVIIVALMAVATIINPVALSAGNIIEILRSSSIYFIGASAATILIVGGGLDLSIGSVFAVGGVTAGIMMNAGVPWPIAILATFFVAAASWFLVENPALQMKKKSLQAGIAEPVRTRPEPAPTPPN